MESEKFAQSINNREFPDMKKLYILLVLFALGHQLHSQNKRQYLSAGDDAFAIGNYYSALTYYNEALEFDPKDGKTLFKSAESARLFDSYKLAIQKYTYLLDTLNYNEEKLILFSQKIEEIV